MPETERLLQALRDSGCAEEAAAEICSLCSEGRYEEMLRRMRKQRCDLVERMHESQQRVDRMDWLIHMQEKQIR